MVTDKRLPAAAVGPGAPGHTPQEDDHNNHYNKDNGGNDGVVEVGVAADANQGHGIPLPESRPVAGRARPKSAMPNARSSNTASTPGGDR
mgnify:CR=1 FL=1